MAGGKVKLARQLSFFLVDREVSTMPVPKFLIYQPDENAPAGAIQDELSSLRCASTLVRCDKHQPASFDPEVYSGLIVLGGGKKSADTRGRYVTEKNCIHQAVTHGKPVFGVCLG